jgi:hypothetical protein
MARARQKKAAAEAPAASTEADEVVVDAPETVTAAPPSTTAAEDTATHQKTKRGKAQKGNRLPVEIMIADNIAPACLGVAHAAMSRDESRIVTARSNGSLAVYRILTVTNDEKKIFNVIMTANTGGSRSSSVLQVSFLGASDEFVVACYGSGNIGLFTAAALMPVAMLSRAGGVARSIARVDDTSFFVACADGAARRYALTESEDDMVLVQTLPKLTGSERALSVAVSTALGIVVVGDDARNITAWELNTASERISTQRWSTQIPAAYPLALAINETAVAVGTSLNEVVFVDPQHGVIVNTYEHHKGPVTVVTEANGVFYASGWHESLRAYRAVAVARRRSGRGRAGEGVTAADYTPAEAKRRTHYHECTSVLVGADIALSTARDGTIMFNNLEKLFTNPASYIDSQVSCTPHTLSASELLFTHRVDAVEVYRVLPHTVLPLANITVNGDENIRGIWPNTAASRLCVATDSRVIVFTVDFTRDNNKLKMTRLLTVPIPGVAAASFGYDDAVCFVGAGRAVLALRLDLPAVDEALKATAAACKKRERGGARMTKEELIDMAAKATGISAVIAHEQMTGSVYRIVAPQDTQEHIVVATQGPGALHWLKFQKDLSGFARECKTEQIDTLFCFGPVGAGNDILFLNPADGHYYSTRLKGPKIVRLTTDKASVPQNVALVGRVSERDLTADGKNPNPNTPFVGYFPNGLLEFRHGGERWNFVRPADREKAAPNDVKARTEFAALVSKNGSAPWVDVAEEDLEATRRRKAHRTEAATIALEGEASDAEGSDDDRGPRRDPAHGRASAGAADGAFVLRRNIPGLLEGLPMMWRVRRFGN